MKLESLMSALPEEYNMDYMVYTLSTSLEEEKKIWHSDYVDVIKRVMFKKFESWINSKMSS